jgi:hypothetical protein
MGLFSSSRDWSKQDEYNDRAVTEEPVTADEYDAGTSHGNTYVHPVPECRFRPGSRN